MQKLHKMRFLASFSAKNAILHENDTSFCTFLRSIRGSLAMRFLKETVRMKSRGYLL